MRGWQMYIWNGEKYVQPMSDWFYYANGPADAIKKFGLNDPMYEIKYSRKGYGYYTGRIEVRAPETVAASGGLSLPLPADFVLLAVK